MNYYDQNQPQNNMNHDHKMNHPKNMKTLIIVAVVVMIILQSLTLFFVAKDKVFDAGAKADEIVNKVAKKVTLNKADQSLVQSLRDEDIKTLKEQNAIQSTIFKDAQNGDYAILIGNRLIIYRESTDAIIYDDLSPIAKANQLQTEVASQVKEAAVKANLISASSNLTPQINIVQDASVLKAQDPTFYKNVARGDYIVVYPKADDKSDPIIFIYRADTKEIITRGKFITKIQ